MLSILRSPLVSSFDGPQPANSGRANRRPNRERFNVMDSQLITTARRRQTTSVTLSVGARMARPRPRDYMPAKERAMDACQHLHAIRDAVPSSDVSMECLQNGDSWVHLRMC